MGFDATTYAMSKKYTDETAIQFGGLKGAACQIKSIQKQNGITTVTFEWKNDDGDTRESVMLVNDGTPIYTWTSGDSYIYGDLVIYASCFYRCITPNSDVTFDDTKWNEIGSPDGNYDIVQDSSMLPPIFTAADRKMYYSIEDNIFYLWDGAQWTPQYNVVQYSSMPLAQLTYNNRVVQYIGATTSTYTTGYFYKCALNEQEQYEWTPVNVMEEPEGLTEAQMNTLLGILDGN